MKKVIVFITTVCIIFPTLIFGQTEKGKILLGVSSRMGAGSFGAYGIGSGPDLMSFGFSSTKYKSDDGDDSEADKYTGINISPRVGYFLVNNFVAGADFNSATWIIKEGGSDDKSTITLFSAGPFARYYFPVDNVKPFIEGYAYFGIVKYKEDYEDDDYDYDSKSSNNTYGGSAGVAIPVGEKAAFDISIGYQSNVMKDKEDNDENYRQVTGTLGIRFGFTFFLGKD